MNCPKCGASNPDLNHYCGACGARLVRADTSARAAAPTNSARQILYVIGWAFVAVLVCWLVGVSLPVMILSTVKSDTVQVGGIQVALNPDPSPDPVPTFTPTRVPPVLNSFPTATLSPSVGRKVPSTPQPSDPFTGLRAANLGLTTRDLPSGYTSKLDSGEMTDLILGLGKRDINVSNNYWVNFVPPFTRRGEYLSNLVIILNTERDAVAYISEYADSLSQDCIPMPGPQVGVESRAYTCPGSADAEFFFRRDRVFVQLGLTDQMWQNARGFEYLDLIDQRIRRLLGQ